MTEALGRLVTTLDVIGLEAFVPEPPRGAGRPPDDRRALARAFVAKAVLAPLKPNEYHPLILGKPAAALRRSV